MLLTIGTLLDQMCNKHALAPAAEIVYRPMRTVFDQTDKLSEAFDFWWALAHGVCSFRGSNRAGPQKRLCRKPVKSVNSGHNAFDSVLEQSPFQSSALLCLLP